MASHAPPTPDAKRKKPALPSLLSSVRNAGAAIGRAGAADYDHLHDRETRPLTGGAPMVSGRPQLHRGPSSALASTFHNFSQRFGSQWRKRGRRRKGGQGVTIVPQSFYFAVGCFFVAIPVIFVLYILARHSVFGDEDDPQVHKHEVPSSFADGVGMAFESGKELLEMNKIDHADGVNAIEGDGDVPKQLPLGEEDAQDMHKEGDVASPDTSKSEDHLDEAVDASDSLKQAEGAKDAIAETSADGSAKEGIPALKAAASSSDKQIEEESADAKAPEASSDELPSADVDKEASDVKVETVKAVDKEISAGKAEKASSEDLPSASVRKDAEAEEAVSSSDHVKEMAASSKEEEADHGSLRGSQDKEQ
ncbi:hypothetical protein ACHAXT_000465 [Thalassiosira profunda]